jgi:uroporphyrinogen-III synthase
LCKYTAIASVGPVMTAALEAAGIPVEIVPAHPKMRALVKAASEMTSAILVRKRATFEFVSSPESA